MDITKRGTVLFATLRVTNYFSSTNDVERGGFENETRFVTSPIQTSKQTSIHVQSNLFNHLLCFPASSHTTCDRENFLVTVYHAPIHQAPKLNTHTYIYVYTRVKNRISSVEYLEPIKHTSILYRHASHSNLKLSHSNKNCALPSKILLVAIVFANMNVDNCYKSDQYKVL